MKRINGLFAHVASHENLLASFRLARRGCGSTQAVCKFFFHLEPEILRLREELKSGAYRPGPYRFFTIHDPKERVIAVAPFRDRVVHHAVVRVLIPIYERVFIHDSYATRPGKGTYAAIGRAQEFIRRWPWYLKTDVEKYFDSVSHDILLGILHRKIKDRALMALLEHIVRNAPVPGKGLPIGNLTSQFLANVYLDPFDHEMKDELGIQGYARYMDDFVLFDYSKARLLSLRPVMEELLSERLRLRLKPGATWINRSTHGLSFLGMRIFPELIRLKPENRRRSLGRLRRKIEAWENGVLDESRMSQGVASIVGHLRAFCPSMKIELGAGA